VTEPRSTGPNGIALIKRWEGLRLDAYQDSVNVWTIGYGSTTDVHPDDQVTEAEADLRLKADLRVAEECVNRLAPDLATQNQFDALVSFVFNLGCANLQRSTLLKLIHAEDYSGAAHEFSRWNRAGTMVLSGLTSRRMDVRDLFLTPDLPA
jgi:lysozyme